MNATERLPCGAELAPLVDQVAEGLPAPRDGHQDTCVHCRAALRELAELWLRVRELAREEVVPPDGIVDGVIRRIEKEFAADGVVALATVVPRLLSHALLPGARGTTRIADSVVAEIAARAARLTPGVHSLAARGATVDVRGPEVAIELRLVVEYGARVLALAAVVREAVARSVEATTGLLVAAVDVHVADLHLEPE